MKDLVLFPNEETARVYKDDPRFENAMVFLVEHGRIPLEGVRFHLAWVHLYCFEEQAYVECMEVIMHSIAVSSSKWPPMIF